MKALHRLLRYRGLWKLLALGFVFPSGLTAQGLVVDNVYEARLLVYDHLKHGDFKGALVAEEKAYDMAKEKYGPYHPSLVPILEDLGTLNRYLGHYGEAEKQYKWGLTLREQNLGMEDPLVADSLDHLAALYDDLNRDVEAEILQQRALHIREKAQGGPETIPYFQGLLRLGKIQISLQKLDLAEKTLGICTENTLKALGPKNPLVNETLETLAQANLANGHPEQAETNLLKSLELKRKRLTENDPEVCDTFIKLGDFYQAQGKKEVAGGYYKKAQDVYKLYTNSACVYPSLPYFQKAAEIDQALGDHATALKMRKDILKTLVQVYGSESPQAGLCLAEMGSDEAGLGLGKEAVSHLKKALLILKDSLGGEHPLTLSVQKRLASLPK